MSRSETSPETFPETFAETTAVEPSPAKATLDRRKRLEQGVRALALIDKCRRATNDPNAGLAIERRIVERELLDLNEPGFRQTPTQAPRAVRSVVIPVRRIPWPS